MKITIAKSTKSKFDSYALNQCALYGIKSKSKLAKILNTSLANIQNLANGNNNYRIFLLEEETCPFTGKYKKSRAVQEPLKPLKEIHTRIQKLLKRVITPDYAHAPIKGRSYRSNAMVHMKNTRAATFDVRKFYPSTSKSRIYTFFREQLMCSHDVSSLLSTLTCYDNGLSTGSPLSPIMSLHANIPMFEELNTLANEFSLTFTCYVDDLTFSGEIIPKNLGSLVENIIFRHGHTLSTEKTQLFKKSQYKRITGIIVFNNTIRVPHQRFLKARAISKAIENEEMPLYKIKLARKLAGLLGEAAFLDNRFSKIAERSYDDLKNLLEEFGNK